MSKINESNRYNAATRPQGAKRFNEVTKVEEINIHSKSSGKKSNSYKAFNNILPKVAVALAGTGVIAGGVIATSSGFMNGPTIRISNAMIYDYGNKDEACFLFFNVYLDNLKNDYIVKLRCDSWVYSEPIYSAIGLTDSSEFTTAGLYEGTISYNKLPQDDDAKVFKDPAYKLSFESKSKGTVFFSEIIYPSVKDSVSLLSHNLEVTYHSEYQKLKLFVLTFAPSDDTLPQDYGNIYVKITDYLGYEMPSEPILDSYANLKLVMEYSLDDANFAYKYKSLATLEIYEIDKIDPSVNNTLFITDIRL